MEPALVLNASYEPLSVVSGRRAALLVLHGKADALHDSDAVLRGARHVVAVPSVVRLRYFVKVPQLRRAALSRRAVFTRDGWECQYCGGRAESIDHVRPRSRGGAHTWDNVVAACRRCNTAKRDRLLHETGMRLRCQPAEPPYGAWVAIAVGRVPAAWSDYLVATSRTAAARSA